MIIPYHNSCFGHKQPLSDMYLVLVFEQMVGIHSNVPSTLDRRHSFRMLNTEIDEIFIIDFDDDLYDDEPGVIYPICKAPDYQILMIGLS